jgi:hypothetical protein
MTPSIVSPVVTTNYPRRIDKRILSEIRHFIFVPIDEV